MVALLLLWCSVLSAQHKLLVISIDGLDARFLKDADRLRLKIPVLRRLAKQGVMAEGVVGMPSADPWASDTTLVTGVPPSQHGILGDQSPMQVPKVRSLWQAAMDAHLKTALLYWPASMGAKVDFNCPPFWQDKDSADLPFDPIAEKCTPGLVQRISSVYPSFTKAQWNDSTTADGMNYLLRFEQPDLLMIHLTDLEGEQRETGALSVYSRDVLENEDELVGQAIAKLPRGTLVAIISGQGFETENYVLRPKVLVHSDAVDVRDGLIGATNATTASALRRMAGNQKTGIAREVPMSDVKSISPYLSGWVAAFLPVSGFVPVAENKGPAVARGSHRGVHNSWPLQQNYRSVFLLWGDGLKPKKLPEISIFAVAPTLADVLGVKLPAAQHASLWPKIRE